jgi:hypothetical protein
MLYSSYSIPLFRDEIQSYNNNKVKKDPIKAVNPNTRIPASETLLPLGGTFGYSVSIQQGKYVIHSTGINIEFPTESPENVPNVHPNLTFTVKECLSGFDAVVTGQSTLSNSMEA